MLNVSYFDDFTIFPLVLSWVDTTASDLADPKIYVVQTFQKLSNVAFLWRPIPATHARPYLRLRNNRLCRRATGSALDHDRHLPGRASACPNAPYERALRLLSACRHARAGEKKQEVSGTPPPEAPTHKTSARGLSTSARGT